MKSLALLISPRAKSAFFNDYIEVAKAELTWLIGAQVIIYTKIAAMDFLEIEATEEQLPRLASLSFVQGIFERQMASLPRYLSTPLLNCMKILFLGLNLKVKPMKC